MDSRLFVMALVTTVASAAEWPQFRGVNGNGTSTATSLPVEFGPAKNVEWKVDLPAGHSSPVVDGNRIFLTGAVGGTKKDAPGKKMFDEGGKLLTICVDRRNGKILWQREVPRPRHEAYQPTNSPASPSPVVDGKTVYVFFGDFGIIAYSYAGKEKWRKPLGPFNNVNGHGSSPVIVDGLLVLLCDQDSDSYLIALDKDSGAVKWKVERPEVTRSYSTPAVYRGKDGVTELIVPGSYLLTSYRASTGEKLWWVRGLSWQPKSTPVIKGDLIYAHWWENGGESEAKAETAPFAEILAKFDTDRNGKLSPEEVAGDARLKNGFADTDLAHDGSIDERDWSYYAARRSSRNALLAIRGGGRGDLTDSPHIVWRMQKFLPNVPSPLIYDGVMYLVKDGGIVTAADPKSGKMFKQARLDGALETYYSSPVAGAGKVYMASQHGKVAVLKAGEQWELLGVNDFGDDIYATPAIVENRIYLRTRGALYCLAER